MSPCAEYINDRQYARCRGVALCICCSPILTLRRTARLVRARIYWANGQPAIDEMCHRVSDIHLTHSSVIPRHVLGLEPRVALSAGVGGTVRNSLAALRLRPSASMMCSRLPRDVPSRAGYISTVTLSPSMTSSYLRSCRTFSCGVPASTVQFTASVPTKYEGIHAGSLNTTRTPCLRELPTWWRRGERLNGARAT
jgi:hypothetical protein